MNLGDFFALKKVTILYDQNTRMHGCNAMID